MVDMKFVPNDRLNEIICDHIELIKQEITDKIDPHTIILSGSFGKGEVTALRNEDNIDYFSDCEIIMLPLHIHLVKKRQIEEIKKYIYEKTNIRLSFSGFNFGFKILTCEFLHTKIQPTMELYDIKYGSKIIYGYDYLKYLPNFTQSEIPHWEGIRLIFNRISEAITYVSRNENKNRDMIYWTDKILLACQDALLIVYNKYNPSYKKRGEIFEDFFSKQIPELYQEIPNFTLLTSDATNRKLNGRPYHENREEYWFEVLEICDKVLRHVISKEMGFKFTDYVDFQQKYLENVRQYFCITNLGVLRQNFYIMIKNIIVNKVFCINLALRPFISWNHIVYSMIPLLYFSQKKGFNTKKKYFYQITSTLDQYNFFISLEDKYLYILDNPYDSLEKDTVIALWSRYC